MVSSKEQLKKDCVKAGISSAVVLLLTSFHHMYGALIYNTPWRNHIVLPAILTMLLIAATLCLFYLRSGTLVANIAFWLAISSILIMPVTMIGFYEGGYNHVVKNVLYFSGASDRTMLRLFPPPKYEMPDNIFFELTGILQLIVALPAAYYALGLIRHWVHIPRNGQR